MRDRHKNRFDVDEVNAVLFYVARALGLVENDHAYSMHTNMHITKTRPQSSRICAGYWKHIAVAPGPDGALLRFHLLTGAQRVEQLGRLTMDDFDTDSQTVRIRDCKGRRKIARLHDVPLIADALKAMEEMKGGSAGPFLFTVTGGESGVAYTTLRLRLLGVVEAMAKAKDLEKGPFTVGDLRRTVETRLAALDVPLQTRGQLQSHGLGGVQARHYDRHDYAEKKLDALKQLYRLITGAPAKVIALKNKRAN